MHPLNEHNVSFDFDRSQVLEAEQLPDAPYPPEEWHTAAFLADSPQERLLQKYGPVRYEAYLRRSTGELSAYKPDWRLWVGLAAVGIALVLRRRRR
jgi:MYXO-CTERM domain-containing protein